MNNACTHPATQNIMDPSDPPLTNKDSWMGCQLIAKITTTSLSVWDRDISKTMGLSNRKKECTISGIKMDGLEHISKVSCWYNIIWVEKSNHLQNPTHSHLLLPFCDLGMFVIPSLHGCQTALTGDHVMQSITSFHSGSIGSAWLCFCEHAFKQKQNKLMELEIKFKLYSSFDKFPFH